MKFSGKVGNGPINKIMIKFWWRSGSGIRIRIRIRIATLVRRALAEVCTDPVLLVHFYFTDHFSGPGRASGPLCVYVSVHVWTMIFERNDL